MIARLALLDRRVKVDTEEHLTLVLSKDQSIARNTKLRIQPCAVEERAS